MMGVIAINNELRRIELVRHSTSDAGTRGELFDGGKPFCFTLELPWKNNAKSVSCIPAGTYRCEVVTRPSGQKAYEVKNVPGRSAILIHSGNTVDDIQGCILLGRNRGTKDGKIAVLDSRAAVDDFMAALGGKPFELTIVTP